MTDLLKIAIEAVQALPDAEQDAIARQILSYANASGPGEPIPPEDLDDVLAGLLEARRGDLAPEEDVRATLARLG